MAKVSAWLFTLIGVLYVLPLIPVDTGKWGPWLIALSFLVIGITKLIRNYSDNRGR